MLQHSAWTAPDPDIQIAGYRDRGGSRPRRHGRGLPRRPAELARTVALKVIAPTRRGPRFRERFKRESRIAAARAPERHPDLRRRRGRRPALHRHALRRGTDLRDAARRDGPLGPQPAPSIIGQVAGALDAAHAAASSTATSSRRTSWSRRRHGATTSTSPTSGSPSAPPRAAGLTGDRHSSSARPTTRRRSRWRAPLDARTDVYALGCVLYEASPARRRSRATPTCEVVFAHLGKPPPPLSGRAPGLPPSMDAVIARAMAKSRGGPLAHLLRPGVRLWPRNWGQGWGRDRRPGRAAASGEQEQAAGAGPGAEPATRVRARARRAGRRGARARERARRWGSRRPRRRRSSSLGSAWRPQGLGARRRRARWEPDPTGRRVPPTRRRVAQPGGGASPAVESGMPAGAGSTGDGGGSGGGDGAGWTGAAGMAGERGGRPPEGTRAAGRAGGGRADRPAPRSPPCRSARRPSRSGSLPAGDRGRAGPAGARPGPRLPGPAAPYSGGGHAGPERRRWPRSGPTRAGTDAVRGRGDARLAHGTGRAAALVREGLGRRDDPVAYGAAGRCARTPGGQAPGARPRRRSAPRGVRGQA